MIELSIIIPTKDRHDLLQLAATSILQSQGTPSDPSTTYEVIVVDTGNGQSADWAEAQQHRAFHLPGGTFAQACNQGASKALGSEIILMNDDVQLQPDSLIQLCQAVTARHAVVGARLLYPNGLIQHAGIGFDNEYNPYQLWRGAPAEHPEAMKERYLSAVTFALVAIPASVWTIVGGLDEGFPNAYDDVDFCLRAREQGYSVVYDPRCVATHIAEQSAGRHDRDAEAWAHFKAKWIDSGRISFATGVWPFSIQRGQQP